MYRVSGHARQESIDPDYFHSRFNIRGIHQTDGSRQESQGLFLHADRGDHQRLRVSLTAVNLRDPILFVLAFRHHQGFQQGETFGASRTTRDQLDWLAAGPRAFRTSEYLSQFRPSPPPKPYRLKATDIVPVMRTAFRDCPATSRARSTTPTFPLANPALNGYDVFCTLDRVGREQHLPQQPVSCQQYLRIPPA